MTPLQRSGMRRVVNGRVVSVRRTVPRQVLKQATLIIPYYRNPKMLLEQLGEIVAYPEGMRVIIVDDGSPERAADVIRGAIDPSRLGERLSLYRIDVNIPWNRGGARNLGVHVAKTEWIIHIDIDHLLPADCAKKLLEEEVSPGHWYRFPRFRRGTADETRRKDKIPDDVEFGPIHPHIDSYLCTRELYWRAGGYDEDYSGCLGGGSPFLKTLERKGGPPGMVKNAFLCVYTRSVCDDASDNTLSRDTSEYSRRRKEKEQAGNTKAVNPMRFPWRQVTLELP